MKLCWCIGHWQVELWLCFILVVMVVLYSYELHPYTLSVAVVCTAVKLILKCCWYDSISLRIYSHLAILISHFIMQQITLVSMALIHFIV